MGCPTQCRCGSPVAYRPACRTRQDVDRRGHQGCNSGTTPIGGSRVATLERPRPAQRDDNVWSDCYRSLPHPGLLDSLGGALGARFFLTMIYLSMPPWPGLPPNPKVEGHYLIVSKNLIELIACLVLATTPSGHWIGFDALFFGPGRRRRLARAAQARETRRGERS